MKKLMLLALAILIGLQGAFALQPRMVFEKYLWAEGVDPKARDLTQLMVKFYDEDMVRLRNGQMVSLNGARDMRYTNDFLARHPEIRADVIIKSETEEQHLARLARIEAKSGQDLIDMFSFYCFYLPAAVADPAGLLADILGAPEVETAYYEPIPYDATCTDLGSVTPNWFASQNHYDAAPLGVDYHYVRTTFGADLVDGSSGTWAGIFERGADVGHEDYTDIEIRTGGGGDTDNDHGTAVAGIVGACDDNAGAGVNRGMLGFVADHTIKIFQRNSPNYGSTADVYNYANTQLLAGEITTSSWQYTCSPCPPGQSCPCNPDQNGGVPCEYNASVKAAIQAGTADGIIYCISAGNGCVNLDHTVFGSTFNWATGSIYVAAVQSTGDHDASCFTSWGSRVTSCAWGDGVYSLGYGDLFMGTGQNEWYTDTFGGTSAAGPIVAGCAAVLNNIYRDINSGANISPTTMRSWLDDAGTPPGNVTPGNVGIMPNLFGITAPDLNADQRDGWTNVIVPRNTNDASGASAVLPANLDGAPSTTYWNASIENTSRFGTATPGRFRLHRDDVSQVTWSYGSMAPMFRGYGINVSGSVRGGRHTLRCESDPDDEVVEFWEADNSGVQQNWVQQHVWDPRTLTEETPLTFTQPPLRLVTGQTGSYYNCDGYLLSGSGWWDLVGAVSATTAADYDTRVYSEAITSTNGFDDYEAWSGSVGPIDIVGKNNNVAAGAMLASVINWDAENDDYRIEGETSDYIGTPGYGRVLAGDFSIGASEIMEAVEFNVNELVPYEIELDVTAGTANLVISVFGPDDIYFALGNRNAFANANGAGEDEKLCFTPTETGYHLALFHKYNSSDYGATATISTYIGKAQSDLTPNLNTGWSHILVVTQAIGDPPFTLPASLTGDVATNRMHLGLMNIGCVTSPGSLSNVAFYRDGPVAYTSGNMVAWDPNVEGWAYNQGPVSVFGGRHSIGAMIDVNAEVAEWREDNNRHDQQFVWTPMSLTNQTPYLSAAGAPNYSNLESSVPFAARNQDGFRFTGTFWSGVSGTPTNAGDDYNVRLFAPSTGSQNGFETQLVFSGTTGDGLVEWVVENGNINGAGMSYDVGITNNFPYPTDPSLGPYRMYQCNRIEDLDNNASNGPFTLALNHSIHVFDLHLTSGQATPFTLDNMGATDLGLAIYDADDAYGSRTSNGTVVNAGGDGADEVINFVPTTTGWHGVVVFKHNLTDMPATEYRLLIGTVAPPATPAAPMHMVLQTLNSQVNPIQMRAHWDSVTTDINGNPLNVDGYQLFFVLGTDHPATFPAGWTPYLTTTQATLNFTVDPAVVNFRMVVVAYDSGGLILGHTLLPDGRDLRGTYLPNIESSVPVGDTTLQPIQMPARE